MANKILVVDDNADIVKLLSTSLEKEGYKIIIARDGEEAIEKFAKDAPSLILLDIMMPKKNGLQVCREIRQVSSVPIVMVTAKSEDEDVIMGLDTGADDYIIKPFSPKQVVAKVKAILRRLDLSKENSKIVMIDNLSINMNEYIVKLEGKIIELTKKEIEILYLFVSHPSAVYSREKLLDLLCGYEYYGEVRNVDTHIKRIRHKLGLNDKKYGFDIKTVWGVGYKFEISGESNE